MCVRKRQGKEGGRERVSNGEGERRREGGRERGEERREEREREYGGQRTTCKVLPCKSWGQQGHLLNCFAKPQDYSFRD